MNSCVRDEAAFLRSELLHGREHVGRLLLRQVEPEPLGRDPHRVDAALLAEHDPARCTDELRAVRLDRRGIVELRRHRPRLAREQRVARDRFPRRKRSAGALLHEVRERPRLREIEPGRNPVERLQCKSDLDQVGVPCPLPHAVDRALHPGRAGLHRRDRSCGTQAEVVVAVPVDGNLAAEPVDGLADEERCGLGSRNPDRVDDDDLLRTGFDGRLVRAPVEVQIRPRRVDAEERDLDPSSGGERDGAADAVEHLLAGDAECRELGIGDRALDHGRRHTELDERLHVCLHRPREAPDLGPSDQPR